MEDIKEFIKQCRVRIEVHLPNGEVRKGSFGSGYFIDLIEKGATLKDFFKDARSNFEDTVIQDKQNS
ncbi:MAG: hypothetical protein CSA81_14655 [Acidobacteria bacterium]|nr:MAG: hypothetical protein CSA81_14655 [Acidobacteriota bacterium]